MKVVYSKRFVRGFKKLLPEIQDRVRAADRAFKRDHKGRRLRLHKLHGDLSGFQSFSIDFQYRILVEFKKHDLALFADIGTHDIYD